MESCYQARTEPRITETLLFCLAELRTGDDSAI